MAKPKKPLKSTGAKPAKAKPSKTKPAKAKLSAKKAVEEDVEGSPIVGEFDDDDMPPNDEDVEAEAAAIDAETLAAEVERQEHKASDEEGEALEDLPLPGFAVADEATDDVDTVLPSMEGMSILRETELNDVINDVKRRSEMNGGYVTYEELTINQRCLENYDESVIYDNMLCGDEVNGQCINCHNYQMYNPQQMQFHARQSHGGTIICRTEVDELIEQNGHIRAARCRNGETYEGSIFISDVHPALTFSWIRQSQVLKKIFRKRMSNLENTFGMFTASLVIRKDTLPYFNHNQFVYSRPDVWTFYDERDTTGDIGGLMISCRVPEDGSSYTRQIDLMTPMPWQQCQQWEDTKLFRRSHAYMTWKEQVYDRCLALAETVIPQLGRAVEAHYTSTPLTYRDYTLTPCGSAYGVRKDYHNLMMTMLSPRTPIPNLLLTGQNLILHGLEGVAMTARHTCKAILGEDLRI